MNENPETSTRDTILYRLHNSDTDEINWDDVTVQSIDDLPVTNGLWERAKNLFLSLPYELAKQWLSYHLEDFWRSEDILRTLHAWTGDINYTQLVMDHYFERLPGKRIGWKVFKVFGLMYTPPKEWKVEEHSHLFDSDYDDDVEMDCSYGINCATVTWIKESVEQGDRSEIILWSGEVYLDEPICVPYETDGKIRVQQLHDLHFEQNITA